MDTEATGGNRRFRQKDFAARKWELESIQTTGVVSVLQFDEVEQRPSRATPLAKVFVGWKQATTDAQRKKVRRVVCGYWALERAIVF